MNILVRVLKTIFVTVLLLFVVAFGGTRGYVAVESSYYPDPASMDQSVIDANSSWMKGIGDDKLLSEIAIPGTHDSATQFVHIPYLAQCQSFSLADQLNAGYRYLDIRLKGDMGDRSLTFHHGPASCTKEAGILASSLDLNDGLQACYQFLKDHPSETIVFVVKQENSKLAPSDFQDILSEYISQNPDAWYLDTKVPTMGDARGKIVLMQRHKLDKHYRTQGVTLLWEDQRQTEPIAGEPAYAVYKAPGTPNLTVQDAFQYGVDDKWKAFTESSQAMSEDLAFDMVKLNFLSCKGSTPVGHPFSFASKLNVKALSEDVKFNHTWTIVDFATSELAAKIYSSNFNS